MTLISIDWSHKDDKTSIYDGKKISKKLPQIDSDYIVATENMPDKKVKALLDAGAKVYGCSTHQTNKYRKLYNIPKDDNNDAFIIYNLFMKHPEEFYERRIDPLFYELKILVKAWKEQQSNRVRNSNRSWACPDSEILKDLLTRDEDREHEILKQIKKILKSFPIYTEYLTSVIGVAAPTAASLIALTGDINRFANVSCMMSYFGLDVRNGKAPRKEKGKMSNWSQDGRALLLGILASSFVKLNGKASKTGVSRPKSPYREIYDEEKAKQLLIVDKPIIAEKRARRKAVKSFVKDYFKKYKEIVSDK